MNRGRYVSILPLLVMALAYAIPIAHAAPGDVRSSFALPCKYPSGLATDGKHLFVADWREAKIYQLDPEDGRVVRTVDAPTLKPHGLSFAKGKLFVSDDHTGFVHALNLETGVVERTFQAADEKAAGLAFTGDTLFVLAGDKIYRVLPEDGTILRYFDVPERSCGCITFDGDYLWVSNRVKNEIYMVEPERGKVISILDAPGPYSAGITWLDGHLWNVDFQTRKAYRIAVHDEPMYRLSEKRRARVEYLWALNNYGPSAATDVTLNVALPVELPNQKLLTEPAFSRTASKTARDQWDQPCAVFELGSVPAGSKTALTYSVETEVAAIRFMLVPERTGSLADIPDDIRTKYTADGSRLLIGSPYIQETAKKIVGDEKNPYWIARKIYDFVIDSLHYEMTGGWDVPEVVLKRGSGSCSEYTYSFIALCRAAGLPARYQGSIVVRGDDASIDEAFHRWAQVYLPNYGWVPVDANRGDKESPADQARGFGGLSNRFLITTQGGGDSEYLNWGYNSFAAYKTTGYAKIEEDNLGFWEPLDGDSVASFEAADAHRTECSATSR